MTLAIYTDASFRGRRRHGAGLAATLKVVGGPVLSRSVLAVSAHSSHDAECQAARFGLRIALLLPLGIDDALRNVVLISDSDSLVRAVNDALRKRGRHANVDLVLDEAAAVTAAVSSFRAERRSQDADPEMLNTDYMSKMMIITNKQDQ